MNAGVTEFGLALKLKEPAERVGAEGRRVAPDVIAEGEGGQVVALSPQHRGRAMSVGPP
jgi:hypothetical protein